MIGIQYALSLTWLGRQLVLPNECQIKRVSLSCCQVSGRDCNDKIEGIYFFAFIDLKTQKNARFKLFPIRINKKNASFSVKCPFCVELKGATEQI